MLPVIGGVLAALLVGALVGRESVTLGSLAAPPRVRRALDIAIVVLGTGFTMTLALHLADLL